MDAVTFKLEIEPEDTPVRGNVMASGDDQADRDLENEIIERLDRGDLWAWCYVKVTASVTMDGHTFTGSNAIGGCSYFGTDSECEAAFKRDYYTDLCDEARENLFTDLRDAVSRGIVAREVMKRGI